MSVKVDANNTELAAAAAATAAAFVNTVVALAGAPFVKHSDLL